MDDAPLPRRSSVFGKPHPLWPSLHLWWSTWRTAVAAENAYERARARGLPRHVAAETAYKAFVNEGPPQRPELADTQAHRAPRYGWRGIALA